MTLATCPTCERREPLEDCGLCRRCSSAEPLVDAFKADPGALWLLDEAPGTAEMVTW